MSNEKRDALAEDFGNRKILLVLSLKNRDQVVLVSDVAKESYKAGWDARAEEVAELKWSVDSLERNQKMSDLNHEAKLLILQSQLTAAREESRALREALKFYSNVENYRSHAGFSHDGCGNKITDDGGDTALKALAAHAEREEQK